MEIEAIIYLFVGAICLLLGIIVGYKIRQEDFDDLKEDMDKLQQKHDKEIIEERYNFNIQKSNLKHTISEQCTILAILKENIYAVEKDRDIAENAKLEIENELKAEKAAKREIEDELKAEKTAFINLKDNPSAVAALAAIKNKENVFIHGKPGTGKSHFIKELKKHLASKETNLPELKKGTFAIVAPTGLAALNIGGQTIHSYFSINPQNINENKPPLKIPNLKTLVIDEISMVRSDLFDKIDQCLRVSKKSNLPFGGVQLVLLGDVYQLDPVFKESEISQTNKDFLANYGPQKTMFFHAKVWPEIAETLTHIQFNKNFRQKDKEFIKNLDIIREKKEDFLHSALSYFNECYEPNFHNNEIIKLCTTRKLADIYNQECLKKLPAEEIAFNAKFSPKWYKEYFDKKTKKYICNAPDLETLKSLSEKEQKYLTDTDPAPVELYLKEDAKIIFLDNDADGRWVNGTTGKIVKINKNSEEPYLTVLTEKGETLTVYRKLWHAIKRNRYGEQVLDEERTFYQFPIQLAWAITVHKSQGQTLTSAAIEGEAFVNGQIYVALSRIKEKADIHLLTRLEEKDIKANPAVAEFLSKISF